jgi:hypothetical protein
VSKIESERVDIQVFILNTCYNCIRMGNSINMPKVALQANALPIFTRVASKTSVMEVQVATCECIMMLW